MNAIINAFVQAGYKVKVKEQQSSWSANVTAKTANALRNQQIPVVSR